MKHFRHRLEERYGQLKSHPVTKHNVIAGLYRYVRFHMLSSFITELRYKWIGSLQFLVRSGDAGLVGNIYYGLYEFEESIFLLHYMESEDVFIDAGANLGHFSMLLSGMKGNRSFAFEPVPATFKQLERQIALNGLEALVELYQVALGEEEGSLRISDNKGSMDCIVDAAYRHAVEVPVISLDSLNIFSFLKEKGSIAMKLDVEGFELFVLRGAEKLLNNSELKVLIVELNESSKSYGVCNQQVIEFIKGFGFHAYRYLVGERRLELLPYYDSSKFNTLFIRDVEYVNERIQRAAKVKVRNRYF